VAGGKGRDGKTKEGMEGVKKMETPPQKFSKVGTYGVVGLMNLCSYLRLLTVGRALLRSENTRKQSPEVVTRAYAHALFGRRPRRLYLVGSDAHLASFIGCLPRWIQDRLLPFFFHYPRPPRHLPVAE